MAANRRHGPRCRRGNALTFALVAVVLVAALAFAAWWRLGQTSAELAPELITTTVFTGSYDYAITEPGTVENAHSIELKCEVRARGYAGAGSVTIINVVPEGTLVHPGDVVVELDSSALEQEKVTQLIQVTGQKSLLVQAENHLAAAEIARREYEVGTFVQEESLVKAEAYVARQALSNAETGLEQTKRLFDRAMVVARQVETAQFAVEDAKNKLFASETKLQNLRRYTREKMLKTFDSNIATATAEVAAQKARLSLEERRLRDIEDQIAKCTIRAPVAGVVVYANEYDSNNGNIEADFVVMPGAIVRERQTLIRLPSSSDMQVRATVTQARVTLVKPGMPVTIRVDALKDQLIQGEVIKVNQYADPGNWSSGNIKKYATFIKVIDPPPGLRGGMIAEARIHIEQQDDALQVPVQGLAQHHGRYFCLVESDDETYETREVFVRSSNDKVASIRSGLAEGDVVVLSPRRAGSLLELPEVPAGPAAAVADSSARPKPKNTPPEGKTHDREPPAPAGGD